MGNALCATHVPNDNRTKNMLNNENGDLAMVLLCWGPTYTKGSSFLARPALEQHMEPPAYFIAHCRLRIGPYTLMCLRGKANPNL